jgi:hypothetical protein
MSINLNNENFRLALATIYGVDKKYIVLKQGNWYNPTSVSAKPKTWIAYNILRNSPIGLPFYRDNEVTEVIEDEEVTNTYNFAIVLKIAEIDIQFIGTQAEALANNVPLWIIREDVQSELQKFDGKIMGQGQEAYSSSYALDGDNYVTAWNTKIYITWQQSTRTQQILFTEVTAKGEL